MNYAATPILDSDDSAIRELAAAFDIANPRTFLQAAHRRITELVHPVYTVDEFQPASITLQKKTGSCSQRMALLEAVARARGIATRVRALWIDGRFWYPRFRLTRPFIPQRILLIWPQFFLDGEWVDFDELYASTAEAVMQPVSRFTNDGETLFEAVQHTAVDFLGKSQECGPVCGATNADLSEFVRADAGFFDTRDHLLQSLGSLQYSWRGKAFEMIFGGRKST